MSFCTQGSQNTLRKKDLSLFLGGVAAITVMVDVPVTSVHVKDKG
jgi:hypothetical protein